MEQELRTVEEESADKLRMQLTCCFWAFIGAYAEICTWILSLATWRAERSASLLKTDIFPSVIVVLAENL